MSERPLALVTGGTRGIGLGIARALASEGYDLCVNGVRDPASVTEVLEALGEGSAYVQADISREDERVRLLEAVRSRFGRLDLLVNNAGVAPRRRVDILDADEESFDWIMGVNLKGPWFLTRDAARWMIEQKAEDGDRACAVINIGSVSAEMVSTNRGDYCISKAGLGMATMLWAVRLGEHGIPVWEIRPGITETDMTAPVRQRYDDLIASGGLVDPRWGTPEDMGKAVAMLARGDLPYATGQVLTVDGGLTLRRL